MSVRLAALLWFGVGFLGAPVAEAKKRDLGTGAGLHDYSKQNKSGGSAYLGAEPTYGFTRFASARYSMLGWQVHMGFDKAFRGGIVGMRLHASFGMSEGDNSTSLTEVATSQDLQFGGGLLVKNFGLVGGVNYQSATVGNRGEAAVAFSGYHPYVRVSFDQVASPSPIAFGAWAEYQFGALSTISVSEFKMGLALHLLLRLK